MDSWPTLREAVEYPATRTNQTSPRKATNSRFLRQRRFRKVEKARDVDDEEDARFATTEMCIGQLRQDSGASEAISLIRQEVFFVQ